MAGSLKIQANSDVGDDGVSEIAGRAPSNRELLLRGLPWR
jgi:hypothetical protein